MSQRYTGAYLLVFTCATLFLALSPRCQASDASEGGMIVVIAHGLNRETGQCHPPGSIGGSTFGNLVKHFAEALNAVTNRTALTVVEGPCDKTDLIVQRTLETVRRHTISAVITTTPSLTTDTLLDVLNIFGVTVVEMAVGNVIPKIPSRPNHYVAPCYNYWHLKAALEFVRDRKWTTVSIGSTFGYFTSAEILLSQIILEHGDICLISASVDKRVPQIRVSGIDEARPGNQNEAEILLYANPMDDAALKHLTVNNSANQTVFYTGKGVGIDQEMMASLSSYCHTELNIMDDFCSIYDLLSNHSFNLQLEFGEFLKTLAVFANVSDFESKCTTHNDSQACILVTLLQDDLLPSVEGILHPSDAQRSFFARRVESNGVVSNILETFHVNFTYLEPDRDKRDRNATRSCKPYCHHCLTCFPTRTSLRRVMKSGEGSMTIVGLFPLTEHSASGPCSRWNSIGRAAADTFLAAFNSSAGRPVDVGNDTKRSVRGVVIDTCIPLNESERIVNELEYCEYAYINYNNQSNERFNIQPSTIIGYVQALGHVSPSTTKPTVTVIELGYSTNSDLTPIFAEKVLVALKGLNWTVVNVIVSDEEPFSSVYRYFHNSGHFSELCFPESIALRPNSSSRAADLNRIRTSLDRTRLFLLLTNPNDTIEALQHLRSSWAITKQKVSLVVSPWSDVLSESRDVFAYADVLARLRPTASVLDGNKSTAHNVLDQSIKGHRDRSILDLLAEATRKLKSYAESGVVRTTLSEEIESLALEVVVSYGESSQENLVAKIDGKTTWFKPVDGHSFTSCKGWCPKCQSCRGNNLTSVNSLHIPGELVVTGLFPLRKKGNGFFQCGDLDDDVDVKLILTAFLFAVDSAKTRYPELLSGFKVGGLILDSCSDLNMAMKAVGDFETCSKKFGQTSTMPNLHNSAKSYPEFAYPIQNVGYIVDCHSLDARQIKSVFEPAKRGQVVFIEDVASLTQLDNDRKQMVDAIIEVLVKLKWKKLVVLYENSQRHIREFDVLQKELSREKICLVTTSKLTESDFSLTAETLKAHPGVPVVLLASEVPSVALLKSIRGKTSHYWVIPATSYSVGDIPDSTSFLPQGCIVISKKSNRNDDFLAFMKDINRTWSLAPEWYRDIWLDRNFCSTSSNRNCQASATVEDVLQRVPPRAYDVIKHVDAMLHGLHHQFTRRCPDHYRICDHFADDLVSGSSLSLLSDVSFVFQEEQLEYITSEKIISKLTLFNKQGNRLVKVGTYFQRIFQFNTTVLRLYNTVGEELSQIPEVRCRNECACLDLFLMNSSHVIDDAHLYASQQGEFILETWAIVVVAISGSGCFMSVVFAVYVMHKMCIGALGKRYTFLGLTLLLAVTGLYSAVLPFVFTPSELVCALRYFFPGLAYAFCFAVILVKLMTLQNYKFIGLGGDVSGLNQAATVFFITCVQVTSGVHWWLNFTPALHTVPSASGGSMYACDTDRSQFSAYLVYIMFLIVVCCFYSLSVRNETKNMGEAKLLLACSWLCLAIWAGWLTCLFLVDRKWFSVIVCSAILGCATAVMLIVFIPKIRLVSRLKYDLSQKSAERNGYSIDTDFLYERPQSLPGTLTSTFSSTGKASCPRTVTSFDSELSQ